MRVGIIQSNYIPWRGYFDFIDDVDLFLFHDDLQYTKHDWRNRNHIKTRQGLQWLTVPVAHPRVDQQIMETAISYHHTGRRGTWQNDHLKRFESSYLHTPYYADARAILEEAFRFDDATISELNVRLIRLICGYLGINTPLARSSDYSITGVKTDRIIQLMTKTGADTYLSGPAARAYLDHAAFAAHGFRLEYKSYDYPPYPQPHGAFEGAVTVLDLIANIGPEAPAYLKSRIPNEVVRLQGEPAR